MTSCSAFALQLDWVFGALLVYLTHVPKEPMGHMGQLCAPGASADSCNLPLCHVPAPPTQACPSASAPTSCSLFCQQALMLQLLHTLPCPHCLQHVVSQPSLPCLHQSKYT